MIMIRLGTVTYAHTPVEKMIKNYSYSATSSLGEKTTLRYLLPTFLKILDLQLSSAIRIIQPCTDGNLREPPPPIVRDHVHTDHLDPPAVRERPAGVPAHHRSGLVVVDEFAQDACAGEARERAEVDAGLGVSSPREDAAWARA